MTQDAIVTRLLPNAMAEVVVTRSTACGSNCGSCESCIFQSELKAVAKNSINARPGQRVVIESRTSKVFSAAILVYVVPLLFFILGFALASLLGASEGIAILVSFVFLVFAALLLVQVQKRKTAEQQIQFEIIS
ncbi:MAG: SoxR reducing system RseC family protein [Oscillospiraceae bacterium]|nr:SoxR reducing system RseC family protein [Oscillospiraceae bacterium]